jgi:hypothetical protein
MKGFCPYCGKDVEMFPDTHGNTIVADKDEKDFIIIFSNGMCQKKHGKAVHVCDATGKDGKIAG